MADLLQQTASKILSRGGALAAVAALRRAAGLSPRGFDQGRRLAGAAYIGDAVTGHLHATGQLLAHAERADRAGGTSLRVALAAACALLNVDGDIAAAHHRLVQALQHAESVSDPAFAETLHMLLQVCFFGGRVDLWGPFHEHIRDALTRRRILIDVTTQQSPTTTSAAEMRLTTGLCAKLSAPPHAATR